METASVLMALFSGLTAGGALYQSLVEIPALRALPLASRVQYMLSKRARDAGVLGPPISLALGNLQLWALAESLSEGGMAGARMPKIAIFPAFLCDLAAADKAIARQRVYDEMFGWMGAAIEARGAASSSEMGQNGASCSSRSASSSPVAKSAAEALDRKLVAEAAAAGAAEADVAAHTAFLERQLDRLERLQWWRTALSCSSFACMLLGLVWMHRGDSSSGSSSSPAGEAAASSTNAGGMSSSTSPA